jgi:hypothetical protein
MQKASAGLPRRLRWVTGDRLMRIGVGVTVAGLLATVIAMAPLIFPDLTLPGVWWFLSMITGVGLALVIAGLVVAARERRPPKP